MRVSWNNFAQRRNLNLDMFGNMSYKEYATWCEQRRVIPVPLELFVENNRGPEATKEIPNEEEIKSEVITQKDLKKMRKQDLVTLCKNRALKLKGNETKTKLISLLLSMNN